MGFGPSGAARVKGMERMVRKAAAPSLAQYYEPIPGTKQGPGTKNVRLKAEYRYLAEKEKRSMCVVS